MHSSGMQAKTRGIYCRFRGSDPGPLETFRLGRANAPGRSLTCPFARHQGAQRLAGQGVAEGHREATRIALYARGVRP